MRRSIGWISAGALLGALWLAAAAEHRPAAAHADWNGRQQCRSLTLPVDCAVSASYCTIFSITPGTISSGVAIYAQIVIDSNSATVAPQFRVSTADAGYAGACTWVTYAAADDTTTAPTYDNEPIQSSTDTADTAWVDGQRIAEVRCSLLADADPGAILIEWQLETGTSPTQRVEAGSYYCLGN